MPSFFLLNRASLLVSYYVLLMRVVQLYLILFRIVPGGCCVIRVIPTYPEDSLSFIFAFLKIRLDSRRCMKYIREKFPLKRFCSWSRTPWSLGVERHLSRDWNRPPNSFFFIMWITIASTWNIFKYKII